jgi:hypothetical protein
VCRGVEQRSIAISIVHFDNHVGFNDWGIGGRVGGRDGGTRAEREGGERAAGKAVSLVCQSAECRHG